MKTLSFSVSKSSSTEKKNFSRPPLYYRKDSEEIFWKWYYTKVGPTILGIQLYAVAHNELPVWRNLPDEDFGEFSDIKTPNFFALSLDDLLKKGELK